MIDVTIVGVTELQARIAPQRVAGLTATGYAVAMEGVKALIIEGMAVDTGEAVESLETRISGTTLAGLTGTVFSPLERVAVMEEGRRPGAPMPPPAALRGWALRHLGDASPSTLFLVARAIGRRGIPGRHMFRKAAAQSAGLIERAVVRAWGRL